MTQPQPDVGRSYSGATVVELVVADDPQSWEAAGFTVSDDGCVQIGSVVLRCIGRTDHPRGGVVKWVVSGVSAATDLDGLPTSVVEPEVSASTTTRVPVQPSTHRNTSTLIDHVVVATPDIDRTIAAFVAVGMEPRRERMGGSASMPMRQVFLRMGEVIIEVVGPPVAPDDPKALARPASFWGLAFTCADIDACALLLGDAGMGTVRDAVQPGRKIGSLRHEHFGISVPTVFMTPSASQG